MITVALVYNIIAKAKVDNGRFGTSHNTFFDAPSGPIGFVVAFHENNSLTRSEKIICKSRPVGIIALY